MNQLKQATFGLLYFMKTNIDPFPRNERHPDSLCYRMSASFHRMAYSNNTLISLGQSLDLEYFERDPEFLKHHTYD